MYRYLTLLVVVALVPGCNLLYGPLDFLLGNGDGNGDGDGDVTGSAELKVFKSQEELNEYFASQINTSGSWGGFPMFPGEPGVRDEELSGDFANGEAVADGQAGAGDDAAPPSPSEPTDSGGGEGGDADSLDTAFSETTIQEEGVDEADVVKTDGTNLYIISGETLRIVRASPPQELAVSGEVLLEGYGREIYLHNQKVVTITETYGGFMFLDYAVVGSEQTEGADDGMTITTVEIEYQYERPKTIVTIVDVSTPGSPAVVSSTSFDGSTTSSRMIGGVLHLVLATYQEDYYDILPMLGNDDALIEPADAPALLPGFERVDGDGTAESGAVVTWQETYRPTDPDGFGVVTVISMDADNGSEFKAVGVVAEPGLIYSSLDALYLTDTEYDWERNARETTDVYKLAYTDDGPTPVAVGTVPGRILNQYSMGEYDGYLRVATTSGGWEEPKNNVYVLDEIDGKLEVVGSIEAIAAGEEIKAARFVGSRGFVVTFEQIDPLHTLDLSDPTAPVVVGELEVPGYSTFIVPMDADHLLTVGQYIPEDMWFDWGVQLSIFDISDFANPVLQHLEVIGEEGGAYSEALYDPKAFTYFAEADLVALPVSMYGYDRMWETDWDSAPAPGETETTTADVDDEEDEAVQDEPAAPPTEPDDGDLPPDEPIIMPEPVSSEGFDGLIVYRVSVDEGFTELGRLSTCFTTSSWDCWSSFIRGVFIGDDVFAVTDRGVRAAPVSDVDSAPYTLVFESADNGTDGAEGFDVGGSSTEGTSSSVDPAAVPTGD